MQEANNNPLDLKMKVCNGKVMLQLRVCAYNTHHAQPLLMYYTHLILQANQTTKQTRIYSYGR